MMTDARQICLAGIGNGEREMSVEQRLPEFVRITWFGLGTESDNDQVL